MRKTIDYLCRGLLLIVLGVVLLLNNYGVLPWNVWLGFVDTWPFILILGGITLLSGRRIPFSAVLLVFFIIMIAYAVFWTPDYNWRFHHHRFYFRNSI